MPASALLALALLAPTGWHPTRAALEEVVAWPFLSPEEAAMAREALADLDAERWLDALRKGDLLLEGAPREIFSTPPSLPVIEVSPAGTRPERQAKPVDGWRWRLESGWLAAYGKDYDGAVRRFSLAAQGQARLRVQAAEGMAFARTRQRRFSEAATLLESVGLLSPSRKEVLALASTLRPSDWSRLEQISLSGSQAVRDDPQPLPPAGLRGPIGGRGSLPPAQGSSSLPRNPLPPASRTPAYPASAQVEASLILAEAWAAPGPGESASRLTQDKVRIQKARRFINAALRHSQAFPHHRRAAKALAADLAKA